MPSIGVNTPSESSSPPPDLRDPKYQMRLRNIATAVRNKQCILFLGSAIHVESTNSDYLYPKDKCPPTGNQLSELLAGKCHYPDSDFWNLQRVARYYEYQSGFRKDLVTEIRNAVHTQARPSAADGTELPPLPREPSPVLNGLARLEFPIVITTNYDHLYERALEKVAGEKGLRPSYTKSIYSPDENAKTRDCARTPLGTRPYILKIHGDVDDDESIVITDDDYLQFVLRMGDKHPYYPVGKNARTYLSKWPTLFIGYRLSDYNLRLLIKTLRWKMKRSKIPPSYSVDLQPDVLIRDTLERDQYVRFIKKNLWDFVPELYQEVTGQRMPA